VQRRLLFPFLLVLAVACRAPATVSSATPSREEQGAGSPRFDIAYRIAMPDPAAHLYDVRIDIGNVSGDVVRLQMPVWSPGRYARFDFARTVQDLTIAGSTGAPLRYERENGSLWRVYPAGGRSIAIHYRVFANTLSGTFSVLDTAHANWNGASLFMYVVDHKPDPVMLHVDLPAGWHIVNGDARTSDQTDYRFENYDRLIDTPTEVAPALMVDSFNVDGRIYRTMVHHNGPSTSSTRRLLRHGRELHRAAESHRSGPEGSVGAHGVVRGAILGRRATRLRREPQQLLQLLHQGRRPRTLSRSPDSLAQQQRPLARRRLPQSAPIQLGAA
jgi:hypothetical protein